MAFRGKNNSSGNRTDSTPAWIISEIEIQYVQQCRVSPKFNAKSVAASCDNRPGISQPLIIQRNSRVQTEASVAGVIRLTVHFFLITSAISKVSLMCRLGRSWSSLRQPIIYSLALTWIFFYTVALTSRKADVNC